MEEAIKRCFTNEQIVKILREAMVHGVMETAYKHKVSDVTLHTWRKRFSGMEGSQVADLKRLRAANARLKKLVAERDLEIEVMRRWRQKSGDHTRSGAGGAVRPRAGNRPAQCYRSPGRCWATGTTSSRKVWARCLAHHFLFITYEADRHRRLGLEADQPHRLKYKKLT